MNKLKKKRGRKPGSTKLKAATEEMKTFPATDFGLFMANFKSEPAKTKEDSEREALICKINKLKLEIENFKDLKALQSLKKANLHLDMEVLQMKYEQLLEESDTKPPSTSQNPSTSKDSINIKNVIYNNCSQDKSSNAVKKVPETNPNSNYDPNFTYIVSQLLSFFSDKMDANFASHIDSIKTYTHQVFKNEMDNITSIPIDIQNATTVEPPVTVKTEPEPEEPPAVVIPDDDSDEKDEEKVEEPKPATRNTVKEKANAAASKKTKLNFHFDQLKEKILEYLCGKVGSNMVVTTFRRLQRSKAYSMLKQTFDEEHYKLLRIYLFDDGNLLVQDMRICQKEFSKELYHSMRYYAIILTEKVDEPENEIIKPIEEPAPKKAMDTVTDQLNMSGVNKTDYVVLEPMKDCIARPKFRIDMVQDTMICEDFELVSSNPFNIRPINTEVWLTPSQLELLKPIVMEAITKHSKDGIPIISIASKDESLQDFADYNVFLVKNENGSQYQLTDIKGDNKDDTTRKRGRKQKFASAQSPYTQESTPKAVTPQQSNYSQPISSLSNYSQPISSLSNYSQPNSSHSNYSQPSTNPSQSNYASIPVLSQKPVSAQPGPASQKSSRKVAPPVKLVKYSPIPPPSQQPNEPTPVTLVKAKRPLEDTPKPSAKVLKKRDPTPPRSHDSIALVNVADIMKAAEEVKMEETFIDLSDDEDTIIIN